ncbi:MAG: ATP-binding protein [Actinomycetota bacterium]
MVAFFGAPIAHEDDAERAVRAAVEMVSGIQPYREALQDTQGIDFQIRAGINTGPALVGTVGTELRHEYTALGDAMNVAARMEAAARPSTVLITHDTYRLVSATFDVQDLGTIPVKGKAEPIRAYEVIGLRDEPGPKRGIAGLKSPMVGRDRDLETLKDLLGTGRTGRAGIVCILGEPGLGKTRLLAELESWALSSDPALHWVEGHGISYGRSFPYSLVLDLIRSCLGVTASSSKAETGDALRSVLVPLSEEDRSNAYAALGHLLSLTIPLGDSAFFETMDPEQLQKRYLGALKLLVNVLSSQGQVVMVLEDLHWSDAASAQMLTWLLALSTPLPIVVCLTSRHEPETPGWQLVESARQIAKEALIEIRLDALNTEDSQRLVASLLEIESLPEKLRQELLARAEGNPFFIEELIKVLIERGAISRQGPRWVATEAALTVEIPETIRGLLLARIDRLSEPARYSLKIASVVGRRFAARVLANVTARPREGDRTWIDELEASGLVRVAAVEPELEYLFRHSLVQETAYDSLLKTERRNLHRSVGEAIEQLYPERIAELAPELALHFEEAGDDRALGYLTSAAESARSRFALHEARSFYDRALRIVPDGADGSTRRMRAEVAVARVEVGWTFNDPEGEISALEEILQPAESVGDDALLVRLFSLSAMLRQFHGEQYGVSTPLTQAIDRANELSERLDDPALRAGPLSQMGWALTLGGQLRRGAEMLEEALPLLERQGRLIDVGITLDGLAFEYNLLGEIERSDDRLARAYELAEKGDPIARLDFLSNKAGVMFFRNDLDAALEAARTCAAKSAEMGVISCSIGSYLIIGMVHMMQGQPDLALSNLERGAELSTVSLKFWLPLIGAARATVEATLGMAERARSGWQDGIERARAIGDLFVEGLVLWFRALASAKLPSPGWEWILPDMEHAIQLFEKLEMRLLVARVRKDFGTALAAAGRREEAKDAWVGALELYETMGLPGESSVVRRLLASAG